MTLYKVTIRTVIVSEIIVKCNNEVEAKEHTQRILAAQYSDNCCGVGRVQSKVSKIQKIEEIANASENN